MNPVPIVSLPPEGSIIKNLQSSRKNKNRVPLPLSALNFTIPTELRFTSLRESFIVYDSHDTFELRIIIFVAISTIRYLENSRCIHFDGTVKTINYAAYLRVWETISVQLHLNITNSMSNLELAASNALIQRKVQSLGLESEYINNAEIRTSIKSPAALAFYPEDEVISSF
ncbi:hypothetical protein RF11_02436 [Thelohanellus kitauei]|uniref:Uncharacterized protein n=1 Tax=Thelohanellus kitauei TaxID=669202 RepID=A0A0C2JAS6_THEKT|nr:hypothetical protein RF11_02436 [Thelohanellus kitauei]